MSTAAERKKAAQKRGNKFVKDLYNKYKFGGEVDQVYKDAIDWLMDNQDMNVKEFSDGIDAALINNIDKPLIAFFKNEGKELLTPIKKIVSIWNSDDKEITDGITNAVNSVSTKVAEGLDAASSGFKSVEQAIEPLLERVDSFIDSASRKIAGVYKSVGEDVKDLSWTSGGSGLDISPLTDRYKDGSDQSNAQDLRRAEAREFVKQKFDEIIDGITPDFSGPIDLTQNKELVEAAQIVKRNERSEDLAVLLKNVGIDAGDVDRFLYIEPVLIESAVALLKQLEKGDLNPYEFDQKSVYKDINKIAGRNPEYKLQSNNSSLTFSDFEIKNNIQNRINSNPFTNNEIINNTLFVDWLVGTRTDQEMGTSGLEDVEAIANNTKQSAAEKEGFVESLTRKALQDTKVLIPGTGLPGEPAIKIIDPFGESLSYDEKYGGGGFKTKSAGVVKRILEVQEPRQPEFSKNTANPAAAASFGSNVNPSLEDDLRTELLEVRELLLNTTDEKEKTKLLDRYEEIAKQIPIPGDEFKPTGAPPRLMNDPGAMAARRSGNPPLNTIPRELSNREQLQLDSDKDPTNDSSGGGGGSGSGSGRGSSDANTLSPLAMQYVVENFGSVQFFKDPARDKEMWVDSNNDGIKDVNIIDFLQSTEESNPDVIWSLFQTTEWFENNGPAARQFQTDWAKAGGAESWQPVFNADALANESMWNMTPDMEEMLDDTYDSLILEAERIGIDTNNGDTKTAIMQMAFNAKQLNMSEYELKNEFITNVDLAFDPAAVANSGTFGAITSKLKSNAGQYMIKLSDEAYNVLAQDIYLGKTTYEGQQAVWQQQARDDNPAIASMIDQGYTPSAYFSSYATAASSLLGRPIDLLGDDNNLYQALTDSRFNETTGLQRIMTRGEFERHVRSMPEWDTTESARGEAYSTVGSLLESFGVK